MIEPKDRVEVKRGTILQLELGDERWPPGALVIVDSVESWGVIASATAPWRVWRLPWNYLLLTGGWASLTGEGRKLKAKKPPPRHHP